MIACICTSTVSPILTMSFPARTSASGFSLEIWQRPDSEYCRRWLHHDFGEVPGISIRIASVIGRNPAWKVAVSRAAFFRVSTPTVFRKRESGQSISLPRDTLPSFLREGGQFRCARATGPASGVSGARARHRRCHKPGAGFRVRDFRIRFLMTDEEFGTAT